MGVSSNAQSKAKQNLIKVLHKCGLLESVRKGRKKKENEAQLLVNESGLWVQSKGSLSTFSLSI